jgi:hypothetical protein
MRPDSVEDEEAAWTALDSIGLEGVRLLEPTLGETKTVQVVLVRSVR